MKLRTLLLALLMFFVSFGATAGDNPVPSEYRHIHPSLILISSSVGYGMGVVVAKNLILTSAHVVYDNDGEFNPKITIHFYPDFRKVEGKLLKATSANALREVAFIEADTGKILPLRFADKIFVGEKIFWYAPGDYDHTELVIKRGTVLSKMDRISWGLGFTPYEPDTPVGQEVAVITEGDAPDGSSGGPVFNEQKNLVGIIFSTDSRLHISTFTSIYGIRRFLAEYASAQK